MEALHIGFAEADITPKGRIALIGQFGERLTDEVKAPLCAVAMVITADGKTPVYWAACDLLYITDTLVAAVCERLEKCIPDFERSQLLLSATHIHTGPYLKRGGDATLLAYHSTDADLTDPADCCAAVADGVAEAIMKAYAAREEAVVAVTESPIQTGYCRRVVYKTGEARMYGKVDDPDFSHMEYHDGGMTNLMYVRRLKDRRLLGVVANVPCTAQVVEHQHYIHSDYWHYTRAYVREKLGIPVLGLCGCAGDLSPRDLLGTLPGEPDMKSLEGAKYLGEYVGEAIMDGINTYPDYEIDAKVFEHVFREIPLPRWNPTYAQYVKAKAFCEELYEKFNFVSGESRFEEPTFPGLAYSEAEICVKRYEQDREYIQTPVHVIRLGDVLFTTNPFECYIEYADRIKAAEKPVHVFDVQLTDQYYGYLATRRAVRGGGYSALIFNGECAPDGGDELVAATVRMAALAQKEV